MTCKFENNIVVKRKCLHSVTNFHSYCGCTFYLNPGIWYHVCNSSFDNCSFRTDSKFISLVNCTFSNCNFSNNVYLRPFILFDRLPYGLCCHPFVTHLDLKEFQEQIVIDDSDIQSPSSLKFIDFSGSCATSIPYAFLETPSLQQLNMESSSYQLKYSKSCLKKDRHETYYWTDRKQIRFKRMITITKKGLVYLGKIQRVELRRGNEKRSKTN